MSNAPAYPNRAHAKADESARRRAMEALSHIQADAHQLNQRLLKGITDDRAHIDGDQGEVQSMSDNLRKLTGLLGELGALHDVRERIAGGYTEEGAGS